METAKNKLVTESVNNKCIKGSNHGLLRKIQIGKIAADSLSTLAFCQQMKLNLDCKYNLERARSLRELEAR